MFFIGDITYPHIDQNGISGKLTKNELTSPNNNFFGNGRTKLVYDSFWQQGPPKLKKIGLGRFSQLVRPLWTDLRFFEDFELGHGIQVPNLSTKGKNQKLIFLKCLTKAYRGSQNQWFRDKSVDVFFRSRSNILPGWFTRGFLLCSMAIGPN